MKKLITLLSIFLTTSCSLPMQSPLTSVKDTLPIGSVLQLTQTIIIPADRTFMYIANGEVKKLKNYNTVDSYQPYCTIHLYKQSSQTRKIEPGDFEVTKIVEWARDFGYIFNNKNKFSKVEQAGFIKTSMHNDSAVPSTVMYATILSLRSTKQPEVEELVCGYWDEHWKDEFLTLKEMQSALGGLIVIKSDKNN